MKLFIIKIYRRNNINTIKITSDKYPQKLLKYSNMPKVIYAFGDANLLNTTCFSIVGTRHITDYGKLECKYFARELTKLGLTIVSGMAIGTDSIAHDECINNGGKTIAVLGCGFNKIDEKSKKIYNKILNSGGLVISEYEIEEEAKPNNFPHRNRIICGLSEGVLAIEATERSGTGTSMRWAKRLNIPRFACPGRLDSKYGHGVNNFIKEGAIITTDIKDIINKLPYLINEKTPLKKNNFFGEDDNICNILECLDTIKTIEQIEIETKISRKVLLSYLMKLELSGKIYNLNGVGYKRKS